MNTHTKDLIKNLLTVLEFKKKVNNLLMNNLLIIGNNINPAIIKEKETQIQQFDLLFDEFITQCFNLENIFSFIEKHNAILSESMMGYDDSYLDNLSKEKFKKSLSVIQKSTQNKNNNIVINEQILDH